jgi:hypothetical protein
MGIETPGRSFELRVTVEAMPLSAKWFIGCHATLEPDRVGDLIHRYKLGWCGLIDELLVILSAGGASIPLSLVGFHGHRAERNVGR